MPKKGTLPTASPIIADSGRLSSAWDDPQKQDGGLSKQDQLTSLKQNF